MGATEGVGTLIAVYVLAIVFTSAGYQAGNIVASAVLIGMGIVAAVLLKEPPTFHGIKPAARREGVMKQYLTVLSYSNVVASAITVVGLWGAYSMIVFWVPTVLIEDAGWAADSAGFMAALYPLVGVISAVVSGLISDKLLNRKAILFASGLGLTLCTIGYALALQAQNYTLLAVLLPIAGLFHYATLPVVFALAFDSVGARLAGTANGLLFGTGFIVGGLVFPLLLGAVRDISGSFTAGFIALSVSVFLLNLLIPALVLKERATSPSDSPDVTMEPAV